MSYAGISNTGIVSVKVQGMLTKNMPKHEKYVEYATYSAGNTQCAVEKMAK